MYIITCSRPASQHTVEVAIPKELHRFLIGKEGKTLKEIQEKTGTNINVPKEGEAKSTISVTGTSENIRQAAELMQQISEERSRQETIRLPILKAYHALILGPNSSRTKAIAERTNTKIFTPMDKVRLCFGHLVCFRRVTGLAGCD
jgi:rRNA processing protein Krr1/Pno1